MIYILTTIAPLFLIIFISAVFQKFQNVEGKWSNVLNEYVLKIGFPALIFLALINSSFSFKEEIILITANSLFLIVGFTLAFFIGKILKLSKKMFLTLFISFTFGNIGYLGIPIIVSVKGAEALPTASIIVAVYLFWMFTVGTGYLDYVNNKNNIGKKIFKNLIKNPLLIAVALGFSISGAGIVLPLVIMETLDLISMSVTPVVLVTIGLFVGTLKIGKLKEWAPVLLFSLSILFISPAIFYFSIKFLGLLPSDFSISIIEAAMPLAITPFALADTYNLQKTFIARTIALSTILSIISLPFWITITNF